MTYDVQVTSRAAKQLEDLPPKAQARIVTAIMALSNDPRPSGCKKLKGAEGWRIRIGDYRVLYDIEDDKLLVLVLKVGQRGGIYD